MTDDRRPTIAFLLIALLSLNLACRTVTSTPPTAVPTAPPSPTPPAIPPSATPLPTATTIIRPTSTYTPAPTPTIVPPTSTASPEPTATPTAIPPTPTVTEAPPPPATDWSISVWETEITLNTYGWEQALVPTAPGDAIYPYPRLDQSAVAPPAPRTYRAAILENGYTRVTILPDIGGRILYWDDKITGNRLTYANPVIKPTGWGYRSWWMATGGIEWAFPTNEHGLNEWRPWQYQLLSGEGWRGVRVWDVEDRTGMTVEVTLKLFAGQSALIVAPRITNTTSEPHPFQFWINAMLTLSGRNAPSSALHFWVPTEQMIVHSTGDATLPGPGSPIAWPVHAGRDFSNYEAWTSYLGLFATQSQGVVAAYDEAADQGVVRVYPPNVATGVKLFCLGNLPSSLFTDDGSRYFELWGGYTRTFWDDAQLPPGGGVTWEERWYPVHSVGGISWANGAIATSLRMTDAGTDVGLYAPKATAAHLILRQNCAPVVEWDVSVGPGQPFRAQYPASGGTWDLQIWQNGVLVTQVGP